MESPISIGRWTLRRRLITNEVTVSNSTIMTVITVNSPRSRSDLPSPSRLTVGK